MERTIWDLCIQGLEAQSDYPYEETTGIFDNSISYPFRFLEAPMHILAEKDLRNGDPEKAALRKFMNQNRTLHFLAEMQYLRQKTPGFQRNDEDKDLFVDSEDEKEETEFQAQQVKILNMYMSELKDKIQSLPPNWRILQINTNMSRNSRFSSHKGDELKEDLNPQLFLSRASSAEGLDVLHLPPPLHDKEASSNLLQELQKNHSSPYNNIEDRIVSLIETMQRQWLRHGAAWMLGRALDSERNELLLRTCKEILGKDADSKKVTRLFLLLDAAHQLTDENICLGLIDIGLKQALPHILIYNNSHGMHSPFLSTIPSPETLSFIQKPHSNDVYYVLNPDQNLGRTQERLETFFQELGLQGSAGAHPSLPELENVLSSKEGFMYCGHGSSLKNLPFQKLESLNVRAMPLLLGCKSGKLERIGRRYDPMGTANSYMIATAPAMLGFYGVSQIKMSMNGLHPF
ncbi:ESP1 [Lepeophtheirus salmonis]|uniref:separase n=1 Tax=Lepeophtheirus salmonis TaxID=72036 RepID=A0A7R8CI50_LEPSM|nr:ESP1 [Lepeophtheirus salmonis]CAF2774810.1 ESP1 [Lepeophtheirus salmonis]